MRALDLDKVDELSGTKTGSQSPAPPPCTRNGEIYSIGAVSAPPYRDTTEKTGCKPPDWRRSARVTASGLGLSSRPAPTHGDGWHLRRSHTTATERQSGTAAKRQRSESKSRATAPRKPHLVVYALCSCAVVAAVLAVELPSSIRRSVLRLAFLRRAKWSVADYKVICCDLIWSDLIWIDLIDSQNGVENRENLQRICTARNRSDTRKQFRVSWVANKLSVSAEKSASSPSERIYALNSSAKSSRRTELTRHCVLQKP